MNSYLARRSAEARGSFHRAVVPWASLSVISPVIDAITEGELVDRTEMSPFDVPVREGSGSVELRRVSALATEKTSSIDRKIDEIEGAKPQPAPAKANCRGCGSDISDREGMSMQVSVYLTRSVRWPV